MSREDSEGKACDQRQTEGENDGDRGNRYVETGDPFGQQWTGYSDQNTDNSSRSSHHDRLGQELVQNFTPASADRHFYPYLLRTLGHRHQHDVHDSDSTYNQRDGPNQEQHQSHS